ncbi:SIR2 family protein [Sphingomonas sp. 28-62-11]|uniref:SIR2 family protein n=1 Tax=Sphingomonas sp. 28-62-11 TaxID=1970432 RepID=UPI000BC8AF0C|nr:MAG: hypothetical protein B7Y49_02090 [Sphingomonas sp. 28-62-11]
MAFDRSDIPEPLVSAYREGRCAMLVGAGASVGAGLPTWKGLLKLMIAEGERLRLVKGERLAEYQALIDDSGKFLMVAGGLKEDLGSNFDAFIEKTFVNPAIEPTGLHEAIVRAGLLKFVITTNYDILLELAYRKAGTYWVNACTFNDAGEIQRRLYKREFFILKAHGDASKAGNGIILTEIDYRELLYRQRAYQSLLAAMFSMFTIVFVGASLVDPEIKLLLGYLADEFAPTTGPNHFALMAQEDMTSIEETRWFKDSKVQIIPISKGDDYAELTEFVTALHDLGTA